MVVNFHLGLRRLNISKRRRVGALGWEPDEPRHRQTDARHVRGLVT